MEKGKSSSIHLHDFGFPVDFPECNFSSSPFLWWFSHPSPSFQDTNMTLDSKCQFSGGFLVHETQDAKKLCVLCARKWSRIWGFSRRLGEEIHGEKSTFFFLNLKGERDAASLFFRSALVLQCMLMIYEYVMFNWIEFIDSFCLKMTLNSICFNVVFL